MSSQNQKQQHPRSKEDSDIYSVCESSISKYFSEVKENTAAYIQAVTDLQNEIIESRKNNASNAIMLQKTATDKMGLKPEIPDTMLKISESFAEQAAKAFSLQNMLLLRSLDTLTKSIEAYNKNSKSFEDINRELIDSWASIIKQSTKQ